MTNPNPILVFIRVESFRELGGPDEFPMGMTACGQWETSCQSCEYILVLVNDDGDLPDADGPPFMACQSMPLLIVAHHGSRKFEDPIKVVMEKWKWEGAVYVCKHFSHVASDTVYNEIRSICCTAGNADPEQAKEQAKAFVDKCRAGNRLAALDGLAALCQLMMLKPETDDESETDDELLDKLLTEYGSGSRVGNDFEYKFQRGKWNCALELVEQEAEQEAGRLVGVGI